MADEVTLLAQAVVLNYLALHNDVGQLASACCLATGSAAAGSSMP